METNDIDIQKYNELVKSMALDDINLYSLDLNRIEMFHDNQNIGVNANFSIENFKIDGNQLIVYPQFQIKMIDNNTKKIVAKIKCTYFIVYKSSIIDNMDEIYIQLFIGKTIQYVVWPYLRETIGSLTAKMGYPPLVLPIYVSE